MTTCATADDTFPGVVPSKTVYTIIRDEGGMKVVPDTPELREFLTLQYRDMQKEGGRTKFIPMREAMYKLTSVHGQAALFTHQGFWKETMEFLKRCGCPVTVKDVRPTILDAPDYNAALSKLRPHQKDWIRRALETGDSGLLGAPTRYGKSYGMTAICQAFPRAMTVITAPGVDLCKQLHDHFRDTLPEGREILGVYTGSRNSRQSDDITICSVDSLYKMNENTTDLLIMDEPHALVSDKRLPCVAAFVKARKYGFGATLNGRFDKKDRLIVGMVGPILSNVTYAEAVAWKAIAPLKVLFVKVPFSKDTVPGRWVDRDMVYKRLLTQSSRAAALVKRLVDEVIPEDWQTMAFIKDEKQAEFYLENAFPPHGTIAMAKRMKVREREDVTNRIAEGEIVRVLASNIYVQGLTFPDLKVVINLAGGGANTTAIQKPGRLLQTRPGKNYGVMIDFMFECRDQHMDTRINPPYKGVVGECHARYKAYKEIGYDIEFVESADRAREIVMGAYAEGDAT